MPDQTLQIEDDNKSGVRVDLNSKLREPHFEKGDDCEMIVTEEMHGDVCTYYKHFTIRAMQQNVYGYWEYRLNVKNTGEEYQGEAWYSESDLKDI